jgi:GNAT superfamily N-acetyltransferase
MAASTTPKTLLELMNEACTKAGVKIRHAVAEDIPRLIELLELLSPSDPGDPRPSVLSLASAFRDRASSAVTLIAEEAREGPNKGKVLGTCSVALLRRLARNGCVVARLEDVVTDKIARGRGVAEALCEAAKHEAAIRGAYAIDLRCVPKLVPYYGKFGWKDAGMSMRCKL